MIDEEYLWGVLFRKESFEKSLYEEVIRNAQRQRKTLHAFPRQDY